MGFWLLIRGVGMGGGGAAVVPGPYCVAAVGFFAAGAVAHDVHSAGAVASDSYAAGAVAAGSHAAGAVAQDTHSAGAVASQGGCCQ